MQLSLFGLGYLTQPFNRYSQTLAINFHHGFTLKRSFQDHTDLIQAQNSDLQAQGDFLNTQFLKFEGFFSFLNDPIQLGFNLIQGSTNLFDVLFSSLRFLNLLDDMLNCLSSIRDDLPGFFGSFAVCFAFSFLDRFQSSIHAPLLHFEIALEVCVIRFQSG